MRKLYQAVVYCLVFPLLVLGAASVSGMATSQSIDDPLLNNGRPVRLVGTSAANSPIALVADVKDPAKKLWCLTTNLWAVRSAQGQGTINYTGRGEIVIDVDLQEIDGQFGGYPAIIYGRSPWSKKIAADQTAKFPIAIKKVKALDATVSYELEYEKCAGNIAYDLWLTPAPFPTDPTGGIEVMIWLWDRKTGPLGTYQRTENKKIIVNGTVKNAKFLVYTAPRGKDRQFSVVSFVLDRHSTIQQGSVALDLKDFIRTALTIGGQNDQLYLQGIEYGVEFTNQDQDFTLKIDRFKIEQKSE